MKNECQQPTCDSSCRSFSKCPKRLDFLEILLTEAVGQPPNNCFLYEGQKTRLPAIAEARA